MGTIRLLSRQKAVSACYGVQKIMFHIFHTAVFPTSNLHTIHVLHVHSGIVMLLFLLITQKNEWGQKLRFKR